MKILIIGGKQFLGIALVEALLHAGHTPTLFNRGLTNPELFPKVKQLIGDREKDLDVLKRRKWDAVIDTCGYLPQIVKKSAEFLSKRCEMYVYISSISVYRDYANPDIDENYDLAQLEDPDAKDHTGPSYGPLKALCEYEIQQHFKGTVLVIRPGLIVGSNDPTDRFTYWPWRVSLGGNILAPAPPSSNLQFIDVRDLAAFIIRAIENQKGGVYNTVGPKRPGNFGSLLVACREAASSDANFIWVAEPFLLREEVAPWTELPLWVPTTDPVFSGFYNINNNKAVKDGLKFRALSETVVDILKWLNTQPKSKKLKAGLDLTKEATLLKKYQDETDD